MVEEGNRWTVINLNAEGAPDGEVKVTTVVQKIAGDSVCDGVSYKRLVVSSEKEQNAWLLHALLREADKRVWVMKDGVEYLVYDFNVKEGDKLTLYNSVLSIDFSAEPTEYTVAKVDSVENLVGKKVARYELARDNKKELVYERYGSVCGWMRRDSDGMVGGGIDRLRCFLDSSNHKEIVLPLPWNNVVVSDEECSVWANVKSGLADIDALSDSIFYSYNSGRLVVEIEGLKTVNVYSVQGTQIFSMTTELNAIDLDLLGGVYVVEVLTVGNRFVSKIVVR